MNSTYSRLNQFGPQQSPSSLRRILAQQPHLTRIMTSIYQDKDFLESMIGEYLLERAIEWIASNLKPSDVFDDKALENWAIKNGFEESQE